MDSLNNLIFDRTELDVLNKTDKGFYNATDLNRVGHAVQLVHDRFAELGYYTAVTAKQDWTIPDIPAYVQMQAYKNDIKTLRDVLDVISTTPEAPTTMDNLTYQEANNIEQILSMVGELLDKIPQSYRWCGTFYCNQGFEVNVTV